MRTSILISALVAALLLAPMASAAHSVAISSGKVKAGDTTITVTVDKFKLVPFADKTASNNHVKGEGHIHYLVNGKDACSAGKATCAAPTDYATTATSFTFKDLKEGDKITVELVLSDHGPSGTDAAGNLDGKTRVLTEATVADSMGIPGVPVALLAMALVALAFVVRRTK